MATPEVAPTPEPEPKPEPKPEPAPAPKAEPTPEPKQAVKAEQSSAGRAEQRAAGSGGRQEAGSNGAAQVASSSKGQQQKLLSVWGSKVRSSVVRRKRSPRGQKGTATVMVTFTVSRDGQLMSHRIARSSGNSAFDQAALKAVTGVRRFPKAPKKLQVSSYTFNLPLKFE